MGFKSVYETNKLWKKVLKLKKIYEGLYKRYIDLGGEYERVEIGDVDSIKCPNNIEYIHKMIENLNKMISMLKSKIEIQTRILPFNDTELKFKSHNIIGCSSENETVNKQSTKVFFKIIIPNYNNYKYIKKCLDSILEQTFKDYVCIVVDDLSTDDSPKIAEIYAKRYPDKFKFVRLQNKGHEGGARNAGIDYPIDCEYYYFVDSDDYLYNKDCLMSLYNNVKKDMVDILLFNMIQLIDGEFKPLKYEKFDITSPKVTLSHGSASSKIVRAHMIVKFLENCDHGADNYQWCSLLNRNPSVREIDDIIYVYRRTNTSLTKGGNYDRDTILFYSHMMNLRQSITNKYVAKSIDNHLATLKRKIDMQIDILEYLIKKYNLRKKSLGKKKCLIIGANNSIKDFNAAEYVNNTDRLVIRINRPAQPDMIQHYGDRCDMIFGTEVAKKLSEGFENKINISDADVKEISKKYVDIKTNQLTTGYIAIMMCKLVFDDIEIFGFGYDDTKEDEVKYTSVHDDWDKTRHKINFEHGLILDELKRNKKFHRFENDHLEFKIGN